jgi:CBS domain-containing protein
MRSANSTVASYCIREVVTVTRETPVLRCAQLMHDEHVGAVVIIDDIDGKLVPVGLLTDRDIAIEVVAFDVAARTITAGDLMSGDLAVVRPTDDVLTVLATMREHGVRRLPVIGEDGSLEGIVTADNLWEVLAEAIDGLARLVSSEQARERKTRAARSVQGQSR